MTEEEWEVVYETEETHRGYIRTIAELEAQNKALTDMVEMQSEKISKLEYDFCGLELKATKLIKIIDSMLDYHPSEVYDLCLKYNYYEPKDN